MNHEQKKIIKATWLKLSAYYQYPLQDHVFEMYADDVDDLSFDEVAKALHDYRRNPKNSRVPLPATIRSMVIPVVDDDAAARDVASRLMSAVKRFGWTNPIEASQYVGPIGWEIVKRNGGWQPLCESLPEDASIFQAQARDLAKSIMVMARAGKSDIPPQLPESSMHQPKSIEGVRNILSAVKTIKPEIEK